MKSGPLRAVVCDDDPYLRKVVGGILAEHGFEPAGEAAALYDAVSLGRLVRPDVMIVGTSVPGAATLDGVMSICEAALGCQIVLLAAYELPAEVATSRAVHAIVNKATIGDLGDVLSNLLADRWVAERGWSEADQG
jgi:AmiR/NasT family two-component response regulator